MGKKRVYDLETGDVREVGVNKDTTPTPKANEILIAAFCREFGWAEREEEADRTLYLRDLRSYFSAWIIPKMPDPLPAYIDALELAGYPMLTSWDGSPALFVRRKQRAQPEYAEVVEGEVMLGEEEAKRLVEARKLLK